MVTYSGPFQARYYGARMGQFRSIILVSYQVAMQKISGLNGHRSEETDV